MATPSTPISPTAPSAVPPNTSGVGPGGGVSARTRRPLFPPAEVREVIAPLSRLRHAERFLGGAEWAVGAETIDASQEPALRLAGVTGGVRFISVVHGPPGYAVIRFVQTTPALMTGQSVWYRLGSTEGESERWRPAMVTADLGGDPHTLVLSVHLCPWDRDLRRLGTWEPVHIPKGPRGDGGVPKGTSPGCWMPR